MTTTKTTPAMFKDACKADGAVYSANANGVVRVTVTFTPNDKAAYARAESTCDGLIAMVPARGGSIWGTTGDSVGGAVGLANGYMTLNVSGVAKRFAAALA